MWWGIWPNKVFQTDKIFCWFLDIISKIENISNNLSTTSFSFLYLTPTTQKKTGKIYKLDIQYYIFLHIEYFHYKIMFFIMLL